MTVSAPHNVDQVNLSTSSLIDDTTAEFPMFALDFDVEVSTDDHRFRLGVIDVCRDNGSTFCHFFAYKSAVTPSRVAMNSISGVMMPFRA